MKQTLFALLAVFLLWPAPYATSETLAAGPQHVLLVTSDGKVWSWGYAGSGRLGTDATDGVFSPAPIAGLTDVIRVAAGREHSVALRRDGTVWVWGDNSRGQLGNGAGAGTAVPVKVADLAGISAITAGDDHTLAWSVDGSVWAWGANDSGQLGTGTPGDGTRPARVSGLHGVISIGAGARHSLAALIDGSVWAWGDNRRGQLGTADIVSSSTPIRVSGLPQLSILAGGEAHSLALAADGTVWSWGGTTPDEAVPSRVSGLPFIMAIAAGGHHDLALSTDGHLWAWGANNFGQLGDGTGRAASQPVMLAAPVGVVSFAAGKTFSVAVSRDGQVSGWGDSARGQLGEVTTSPRLSAGALGPSVVAAGGQTVATPAFSPAAGNFSSNQNVTITCATSGAFIYWTINGDVPTEGSNPYTSPVPVNQTLTLKARAFKSPLNPSIVATGVYTLKPATPVFTPGAPWNYGTAQNVTITTTTAGAEIRVTTDLSDPTASSPLHTPPISVARSMTLKARAFKSGWTNSDLATGSYTITTAATGSDLAAGQNASVVLKPDGTVWSWGLGSNGQMGNGSTSDSALAIQATITGVKAIAAGSAHTVALKTDGTVWAWGANSYGQLGNGNTNLQTLPVRVGTLTSIIGVAAGDFFSVAVSSTGVVWTWGRNDAGQLGDASTAAFKSSPVNPKNFSGANAIAAGNRHVLARKTADSSLWSWGANANGQLGNGNQTNQNKPVAVLSIASVGAIAAGSDHSLATKTDGTLWSWGSNAQGQIGDGTFNTPKLTPTQVTSLVGIVRVAAGDNHSVAVSNDGHAWTWGSNNGGQMGTGAVGGNQATPLPLSPNPVARADGGTAYSLAITDDGTVWSWGGDLTSYMARVPTPVSAPAFAWMAAPATFNRLAGTYQTTFSVTLTTATPGVAINYTTDGSVPLASSPSVSNPGTVLVDHTLTLKARVFKPPAYAPSLVTPADYILQPRTPTFIPANGSVIYQPTNVTFSCLSDGYPTPATVYYTTLIRDPIVGTDPSAACGSPSGLVVSSNVTIRAIATHPGWLNSGVGTATYTIKVAAPVYSPGGGSYTGAQTVQLTTVTPNALIHFTTDGTEPSQNSASVVSGGTVSVARSLVLKSKGYLDDWPTSDRTTATYILSLGTVAAPTMTPAAGTYSSGQAVTLASATSGAIIRYTLDGITNPTLGSNLYQYPIVVASSATLKAKAFKTDWTASAITTGAYTINSTTTAAPTLSPRGGPFTIRQTITVTCDTPGAVMHFTTNGADPTEADTSVSGGTVVVDHTQTLKVKAWAQGLGSPVTREDYVITGAVAAGRGYTVALKADGSVWSWGDNAYGELGDQTFNQSDVPVQAYGLSDVVAISARETHTLALDRNGGVWAWGNNGNGQLGIGGTANQNRPVQIQNFSGVVAVAAGWNHSLALKSDGSVYYWGLDGINPQQTSPTLLTSLSGITQIAAGSGLSLALKTGGGTTGAVWIWGSLGWLGGPRAPFIDLADAAMVAAGNLHVVAAKTDGSLWVWGDNGSLQLGYGTVASEPSPHLLLNISSVAGIAGGGAHTLVRGPTGVVWGWGYAYYGETGPGQVVAATNPHVVVGIDNVVSLAAGNQHSVALKGDGTIWTWGLNSSGQLANGTPRGWPDYYSPVPAPVIGFTVAANGGLSGDPDGDGLTTEEEYRLGTDPYSADTNGDGIPDGVAIKSGISTTNPDMDADGASNAAELAKGTDPFVADTDGDGVNDGQDCFPLDPTRWQCPVADPNDHTPPTITLQEPTNVNPPFSVVPPQ